MNSLYYPVMQIIYKSVIRYFYLIKQIRYICANHLKKFAAISLYNQCKIIEQKDAFF